MVKADVKHDYYGDLDLTSGADTEDIKKQFRKLALKYHPDRNPGHEAEFNSKFQAIQFASEILTDPQQRARYDAERQKAGYCSIYSSPVRPNAPPRSTPAQFAPPPRPPPPPSSKPAYPKPAAVPKPNTANPPSHSAYRYAQFAKSEAEAKQARAPAEQWEKAKEDAETKAGAYRAWEQMASQQNFRQPSRPKPQEYTGFTRSFTNPIVPNGAPKQKSSREKFPGPQAPLPGMPREYTARKRHGFAPSTPGGDEPMAQNTSAYFNLSRGERPQASMPQSHFDGLTPGQAPTARRRYPLSPLRHSRSHDGDELLSGLAAERPDGRYPQSGAGERMYSRNSGLGRFTSVRDPSKRHHPPPTSFDGPRSRHSSGRHRSASPRYRRSPSSSSSSSDSPGEDNWTSRTRTSTHKTSKESDREPLARPAVRDFGEAKTFFDQSGRYGPRDWQQENETTKNAGIHHDASHNNFPPNQGNSGNGFSPQHQRFSSQPQYPPPPPYPPQRDINELQRPLEKQTSWHDPDSPSRARNDGNIAEPTATQSKGSPKMYGISASIPISTPSSSKWSDEWPFSSKKVPGVSPAPPPYWAYPSSVLPSGNVLAGSIPPMPPSKMKASLSWHRAKKHLAWAPNSSLPHSFLFYSPNHPHKTNSHAPTSFTAPSGISSISHSPPPDSKSYSSENLNTTFNPAEWNGTFNSGNEHFAPKSSEGARAPRTSSSPSRGRRPGRTPIQSPTKPFGLGEEGPAVGEAQMPAPGVQAPFAPFSPAKFSVEEWAERLKYSSSGAPPPSATQATGMSSNRSRTPKMPSRSSGRRASVPKPATVSDDFEHDEDSGDAFTARVDENLDYGPMDIDPKESPSTAQPTKLPNPGGASPTSSAKPELLFGEIHKSDSGTNAAEDVSETHARYFSRLSSQPKKASMAPPSQQEARLNLNNLNNVAPFAPSNDGLGGISDLSAALPFESRASSHIPRPKSNIPVIPNPPKGPEPPTKLTLHSWERYIAEMGAYMYEWGKFNRIILEHFNSRQKDVECNMAPKWMSTGGDGFGIDGKKGYYDYMQALKDDAEIRTRWDVSWETHQRTLTSLGEVREKIKRTGINGGVGG